MPDRHVVPAESGWQVEKDGAKRASAKAPTQAQAVKRAVEIVANDGGGQVVVHGADGAVQETRTVEAGAEGTAATAAVTATASAANSPDALVDGADRTAEVGDGLGDRLQPASRRTGEYIHSFTERVAHPVDAAARALNPVRIAGRTAGVVIAGALHVGAVVTRGGTRTAKRSAHAVAGRR